MRSHRYLGLFAIPVLQQILVFSCSSCVPGAGHLANWLLHDLDFRDVSPASVSSQQVMAIEDTTVFYGGPILTMAGDQYSPVSALVVKGDTIIFAGELNEARKMTGSATRQVFLNGRSLMPGFIEPHLHLILTALADNYLLKLSPPQTTNPGIETLDGAKSALQDALKNLTDGKWLVGYGYDPSRGCTTVFDAGIGTISAGDPGLISSLSMPLRFHSAISNYIAKPNASFIKTPPYMLGQANISAIKFWADGSTRGFTAFLNSDYLPGRPSWANPLGNPNYNTTILLQEAMEPWLKRGFQLMVHANGDGATSQTLAAYDTIFKANPDRNPNIRHRIEHFTVTEEEQLQTARNLGLAVSNTIGHVNYWGSTFNDYVLGTDRAQRIDPVNSEETLGFI
ncbi:MAG: hypothetical protein Q9167_006891 [Letrouitia subvulpina]